jgi:fatty acid desaturase
MNVQYQRSESPELAAGIRNHTLAILTLWGSAIALAGMGLLPWRGFGFWIAITGLISFVNTMRTLGAHAYESSGSPLDRAGQLADSIDTPGGMLSGLWAPVGLRYHALHHYFPGLPYHNLAEAHRRLSASLPKEALFHRVTSPSLFHSLRRLLTRRPL